MATCPYCEGEVGETAQKCRGEWLPGSEARDERDLAAALDERDERDITATARRWRTQ